MTRSALWLGVEVNSFPAFSLRVAGASFGEGVGPRVGYAIAWDGEEVARVGEGEEGGLVGSAELVWRILRSPPGSFDCLHVVMMAHLE